MATASTRQPTPMPREASLLGLPRELRLQIYEEVFALDLEHAILDQWTDTHSAEKGFVSVPDLTSETLCIPWLCLKLTCRTIAFEIRARMRQNSFLEDAEKRTYTLDLEATRRGVALGTTTWRRLPCAPQQTEYLHAFYNASRGFQAWGDGGPHGITSGLYQTLNHFVHCGPRLDSRYLLPKPLHLKELRITIESRGVPDEEDEHAHYRLSERDTNPKTTLYSLGTIVGQIKRTGVLRGFMDRIVLACDEEQLVWYAEDAEGNGIPEHWNRYGFDWGMELYQTS
ncbi:Hypothetical predicted protein [Lecanosticta acicola]|uniref:Uncharacterized protein n=1 Tax=Lecanosticta acicola TaxID=111012 RepID=A0AAI8Z0K1_9PEZI|nr:Hypothetical predicted protein [Lecanosticta acicola]